MSFISRYFVGANLFATWSLRCFESRINLLLLFLASIHNMGASLLAILGKKVKSRKFSKIVRTI